MCVRVSSHYYHEEMTCSKGKGVGNTSQMVILQKNWYGSVCYTFNPQIFVIGLRLGGLQILGKLDIFSDVNLCIYVEFKCSRGFSVRQSYVEGLCFVF